LPIEDFENYDCKSISDWDWDDSYDYDAQEEHEYSYYNSEAEMQEHPERFWFDEETGDWERIDL